MTLKKLYQSHFFFSYSSMDQRCFDSSNYYQWRQYENPGPVPLLSFCVEKKFFVSKAEAKRKLREGAIRIGLADEHTSFRRCAVLKEDRALEPNDLVRMSIRCFGIYPKKPTLKEEIVFFFERLYESLQ